MDWGWRAPSTPRAQMVDLSFGVSDVGRGTVLDGLCDDSWESRPSLLPLILHTFLVSLFFYIPYFPLLLASQTLTALPTKQASDRVHAQSTVPCVTEGHRKGSKEEVNSQSKGKSRNGSEVSV